MAIKQIQHSFSENMNRGIPILLGILLTVFLFVKLSDYKYRPLVVIKSTEKLKSSLCDSNEIVQQRLEWGQVHHPGWNKVGFVYRDDGVFSHIVKKESNLSERSVYRMWIQHPIRFAKQLYHTITKNDRPYWKEFDLLGPVFPDACLTQLKQLGKTRDEEKQICWDEQVFQNLDCVVFSIGSNNQWTFEQSVISETKCKVYTFDCTVEPKLAPKGVNFFPYCVSGVAFINGKGQIYRTMQDILHEVGTKKIDYLKMDVEGAEFEALVPFLSNLSEEDRPKQIALELHYQASTFDLDENALLAFGNYMFFEAGYVIAHRSDNPYGYFATEILFVKIKC